MSSTQWRERERGRWLNAYVSSRICPSFIHTVKTVPHFIVKCHSPRNLPITGMTVVSLRQVQMLVSGHPKFFSDVSALWLIPSWTLSGSPPTWYIKIAATACRNISKLQWWPERGKGGRHLPQVQLFCFHCSYLFPPFPSPIKCSVIMFLSANVCSFPSLSNPGADPMDVRNSSRSE